MINLILEKVHEGYRLRKGNILVRSFSSSRSFGAPVMLKSSLDQNKIERLRLEEIIEKSQILQRERFVRLGLVSSFGTVTGEPIRMAVPNFGLLYIQSKMDQSDYIDCLYIDPNLVGLEKFGVLLKQCNFDVLGFSILNTTFRNDLPLIMNAKKRCKKIVLGGPTINTFPQEALFNCLGIDHLVIGDGSEGLERISKSLLAGRKEDRIIRMKYNVAQRATFKFDLLMKEAQDCIQERKYNIMYEQITAGKVLPYNCVGTNPLRIKISDNCRGRCIFCTVSKHKKTPESPERIIEIINQHIPFCDSVEFEDHEFTFHKEYVKKLCKLIVAKGLEDIPKQCCTRADSVSPEILGDMKDAGIEIVNYGIESFDQKVLDYLRKGTTENQGVGALDHTLHAGIKPGINLILFSPVESIKSLEKTVLYASYYLSRGAALNIVNRVTVCIGDRISKDPTYKTDIVGKEVFLEEMNSPLFLPDHLRVSPALQGLYQEMLKLSEEFCKKFPYISVHTKSASYILGLTNLLASQKSQYNKVEEAIQRAIGIEQNRGMK